MKGSCNNGGMMSTKDLLELYPEFKPLWQAANTASLRYYVRKMLLECHKETIEL